MKTTVKEVVNTSLDALRVDFSAQVGLEVRAEVERQTQELMEYLHQIHDVKSNVGQMDQRFNSMNEYLDEVSSTACSVMSKTEDLAKQMGLARTQLSSISALVVENLKVRVS